jgi:urea carboxylase system permease
MSQPFADTEDLARAGYRQSLDRTLGRFSSFAAGFSYISILTGMFQNFHLGFAAAGPAFFWTWPAMFLGQLMVALCFAELSAHYPLCGGVYQWGKLIGGRAIGWLAGFVYLASLVITLAAVAVALQITLPQISPHFQLIGDAGSEADRARNAVLFGCLLIGFSTLINSVGVRLLAAINNVGVVAELCGVLLLIGLLATHSRRGPEVVLMPPPGELLGSLCAAAIMASYVMYGFDTAGSLAEETHAPRRTAPRAILQALSAAAFCGALLMLSGLMAAPDPRAAALGAPTGGLPYIVTSTLGTGLGKLFLCDVILAITVCTLAVHTGTVRLCFAMARDGCLPFSAPLSRVSRSAKVPTVPAVAAGLLAAAILIVNMDSPRVIETVVSVSIVWANLAYLLVTGPLLYRRLRGWPARGGAGVPGLFSLGRLGVPVNALAVLWGVVTIVNMGWPRPGIYGTEWYRRYAAPLLTGLLLLAGLAYGLHARRTARVLEEHRAQEA